MSELKNKIAEWDRLQQARVVELALEGRNAEEIRQILRAEFRESFMKIVLPPINTPSTND